MDIRKLVREFPKREGFICATMFLTLVAAILDTITGKKTIPIRNATLWIMVFAVWPNFTWSASKTLGEWKPCLDLTQKISPKWTNFCELVFLVLASVSTALALESYIQAPPKGKIQYVCVVAMGLDLLLILVDLYIAFTQFWEVECESEEKKRLYEEEKAKVIALEAEKRELTEAMTALKDDKETLKDDKKALETEKVAFQKIVRTLEAKIQSLENEVQDKAGALEAEKQDRQKVVARLGAVKQAVNDKMMKVKKIMDGDEDQNLMAPGQS